MPAPYEPITFLLAILLFALGTVVVALYVYGAFWAFKIRNGLISRLYRDRALWVGTVAIFFVVLVSSNLLIRSLARPTST